MKTTVLGLCVFCLLTGTNLGAAEYFVSLQGDDSAAGLARQSAFRTVQRGLDALVEGDTLTILPGEYFGAVRRDNLGGPGTDTLIRAEIPGTVLIRGDLPAPAFEKVPGYRFVHAALFSSEPQALLETDTLSVLEKKLNLAEVEACPGTFLYDAGSSMLYLSSSDLRAPGLHRYTVSVTPVSGFHLEKPRRVTLAGLAVTGFYSATQRGFDWAKHYTWGIVLNQPEECVVRECVTFLNAGGIALVAGGGNLVEDCRSYGNSSRHHAPGGNILRYYGRNDVIRRCYAYRSRNEGIKYYLDMTGPVRLEDNISWGHQSGDYWIKGNGSAEFGRAERCVSSGVFNVHDVHHSLVGGPNSYTPQMPADNITAAPDLDYDREFADPFNHDYRLQADSRFRGAAPGGSDPGPHQYRQDIFYLKPGGDDRADGLSLARAWRSLDRALPVLRPGDTLYLAAGAWRAGRAFAPAGVPGGAPVHVRARGLETAEIAGPFRVAGASGLVFERLRFTGPVTVTGGREIVFRNCSFAGGLAAEETAGLRVEHARFTGPGPALTRVSGVHLAGNLYAGPGPALTLRETRVTYSDYHGYRDADHAWTVDGRARSLAELVFEYDRYSTRLAAGGEPGAGPLGAGQGPYRHGGTGGELRLAGPFLHAATDTTADLEWWTSMPAVCEVAWGETPALEHSARFEVDGLGTFGLTGLIPGRRYYFAVRAAAPVPAVNMLNLPGIRPDARVEFTTAAVAPAAAVYYVAPDGDDGRDGQSRGTALRTVSAAAARAAAGDTVLVAGGTYVETVRVRGTGEAGRPVTFRALPGEKVVFAGANRTLGEAFIVGGKKHLRFDGFYFTGFNNSTVNAPWWSQSRNAVFRLYRADDIAITRCFKDGRGPGYSPEMVFAWHCAGLSVKNCVVASGFGGLTMIGCPGLRLENNVFLRNLISACMVTNEPGQAYYFRRNIVTDSLPSKVGASLFTVGNIESLRDESNCHYLRIPVEQRQSFVIYGPVAWRRAALAYDLDPGFPDPPVFPDELLTRLTLPEFHAKLGDTGSFAADPVFRGTLDMDRTDRQGNPVYLGDRLVGKPDLDFPDLFATSPEVARRGIGLQPEAFADFHFNAGK